MFVATVRRPLLIQTPHSWYRMRCHSTLAIHPSVRTIASNLSRTQPAFSVSPKRITILNEPSEFYALLLEMIRRAERRIFISSLYIGSAETELIDALHKKLLQRPSLQLFFQLDLNRSTRPGSSSTAKLLLPLIRAFPSRVHVYLFRSPHLRGILAKVVPPRINEGWGTWHAKIYGIDDEVMISGANLNKSYFTNRQDRYIHFTAQPHLAQYCFDFLQTVSMLSYKLLPPSTDPLSPHSFSVEGYSLHWPDPHTHPHCIHKKARAALSAFQTSQRTSHNLLIPDSTTNSDMSHQADFSLGTESVILFPIIQAGQFGIREEESALALLFRPLQKQQLQKPARGSSQRLLVDLTSGYFGLYKPYQDLILANDVDTRIVAASPKANGFYGSQGISGRIPEGYTLLEQRFMRAIKKAGRFWNDSIGGVQLSEWERRGWTYHAKGIWISPDSSSPPVLTLFGSTNLNTRSAHIDTELSFIMVLPTTTIPQQDLSTSELPTSSSFPVETLSREKGEHDDTDTSSSSSAMSVRLKLADEINRIRLYTSDWKGGERNVRFWTKVIVGLVKGML